uniref:hypothetical protein n=1 Tax=Bacteroides xylanisolvens TaxID=371601 RepID=UPI00356A866F
MKVIFDTNAAREYITKVPHTDIENYARTNAEKMKKGNINLLVNPIVVMELMYHLLDKNDKDYYISYNTIKALVLTMEYQYKNEKLPMMAVAECIIARDLFNLQIEEREKMYSNLMSGASYIVDKGIDNMDDFISANGTVIKEYVDSVESSFVEQTKIISKIPSVYFSENFLAMYIIRTTYNLLIAEGKMDSQTKMFLQNILKPNSSTASTILQQIENNAQRIATKYPSFIALFKQVIIKVKGGMSDEKIKNYIWDILLMFNITNLTIDKEPVIFITSDKAMLEAANISQKNLSIMTFKELKDKYLQ